MGRVNSKASAKFIFFTILIDALGIGLLIPVFPDVIRRFYADPEYVNVYFGYFISVYALMQLLASPVLGALSDRYGRRPVLLVSLLGAGLDYIMMAMAPNLGVLFAGRIIAGLTGASMTVASAYMADVSTDETRAGNFGLIGAAWGVGFVVGPALGGVLGGWWGPTAPFLVAAGMNILNFVFGIFVLPESLPEDQRRKVEMKRLNPFASLLKILRPSPVVFLVFTFFLLYMAGNSHPSVWTLYTEHKFGWTPVQVGFSLTVVGFCLGFVQGYLAGKVVKKFSETFAINVGLIFCIFGYMAYGLAPEGWMMYPILVLGSLAGLAMPSLQSQISHGVPSNEQGELQGSLISLGSFTSILAPLLYTRLFTEFSVKDSSNYFPGAPYMVATLFSILAFALLFIHRGRSIKSPS